MTKIIHAPDTLPKVFIGSMLSRYKSTAGKRAVSTAQKNLCGSEGLPSAPSLLVQAAAKVEALASRLVARNMVEKAQYAELKDRISYFCGDSKLFFNKEQKFY